MSESEFTGLKNGEMSRYTAKGYKRLQYISASCRLLQPAGCRLYLWHLDILIQMM
jgi:hypothetical protein